MSVQTFTIEQAEIKQSSRGPFLRVKATGIGWVSVFDGADKKFAEEHVGQTVSAAIEENDKGFKNASNFGEPQTGASANGNGMTEEKWDAKEDRKRTGILYSVHLERMMRWKEANPQAADALAWETYDDLRVQARRKAVDDLAWIRRYATGDVPI